MENCTKFSGNEKVKDECNGKGFLNKTNEPEHNESTGPKLTNEKPRNIITGYHQTSPEAAEQILTNGFKLGSGVLQEVAFILH